MLMEWLTIISSLFPFSVVCLNILNLLVFNVVVYYFCGQLFFVTISHYSMTVNLNL